MFVPLLESTRLRLRQYRADDLRQFAELNSDHEVRKYVGGILSAQRASQYLDDFMRVAAPTDLRSWAVENARTAEYIGHAWLLHQHKEYQPDLGILVRRDHWGHGFGPEGLIELKRFAKRELGCTCVYASVDTDNLKSVSMLHRAGFEYLATEKDEEGDYFVFVNDEA